MKAPGFPCHPAATARGGRRGAGWIRCPECGSLLRSAAGAGRSYDDDYPRQRHHHEAAVGECKVRTLERWLRTLEIRPEAEVVCEVGFGGGWCLQWLQRRGGFVFGLEPIAANREHAAALGIPRERLFDAAPLPALPRPPTLWLFQDSFEHVEDPAALLRWMAARSAPRARALIVAPDAASASRRLLGRFWIHHVPDHWIHYSARGVRDLFARQGFALVRRFRPVKCVIPGMAIAHAGLVLAGAGDRGASRLPPWRVWWNIGEMGLLLERHADRTETAG